EFNTEKELVASEDRKLIKVSDGEYRLTGNGVMEFRGLPAFALGVYDRLDGAPNKNGVYSIKMSIGEETLYYFEMVTFAFDETRYINSHIDYGLKYCCRKTVNKLYIEPNNKLSIYD